MKIHACFESKGKDLSCKECTVPKNGSCEIMLEVINKMVYSKNSEFKGIPLADIEDIISNSIMGIRESVIIENRKPYFEPWVRRIVSNQRVQYFRGKYIIKEEGDAIGNDIDDDIDNVERVEEIDLKIDVETFLSTLENIDDVECAKFISDYYHGLKEGLSQKEMAQGKNMIPNSFNQELRRYNSDLIKMKIIKDKFEDYINTDLLEISQGHLFGQGRAVRRDDKKEHWYITVRYKTRNLSVILKDNAIPRNTKIEKGVILHGFIVDKKIKNIIYVKLQSIL